MTELTPEQYTAIEINLATAPKIQEDLRNYISKITEPYDKVGLDDSIFEFAELVGYRINNSRLDIAEDLNVKSLYGLTTDEVARKSVGYAFRGHHNEDFMPDYQFNGLFSEEMNDMIEEIRKEKGGRKRMELLSDEERSELGLIGGLKAYEQGIGIHGRTPEEMSEHGWKGGLESWKRGSGVHALTPEELSENGRIAGRIGGLRGHWRDNPELLEDIVKFRNEGLTWKDTTSKMNEKYDENYTTNQVKKAYGYNKHLLNDEEE